MFFFEHLTTCQRVKSLNKTLYPYKKFTSTSKVITRKMYYSFNDKCLFRIHIYNFKMRCIIQNDDEGIESHKILNINKIERKKGNQFWKKLSSSKTKCVSACKISETNDVCLFNKKCIFKTSPLIQLQIYSAIPILTVAMIAEWFIRFRIPWLAIFL